MIAVKFPNMWNYLATCFILTQLVYGETLTSVDQMTQWEEAETLILTLFDDAIKMEENKLSRLMDIKKSLTKSIEHDKKTNNYEETGTEVSPIHPVKAFVKLNKLINAITNFINLIEENKFDSEDMLSKLSDMNKKYKLPDEEDLLDSGEAIVRLQTFYNLKVNNIIRGILLQQNSPDDNSKILMSYMDCFELGKIAYDNNQYLNSLTWFEKSLELIENNTNDTESSKFIIDLLDYMSFAAYRVGLVKYSAELTKIWLEKDPDNTRALENLAYYEEDLLMKQNSEISDKNFIDENTYDLSNEEVTRNYSEIYRSGNNFNPKDYKVTEDDTVKYLCRSSSQQRGSNLCHKKSIMGYLYPDIKIEYLHNKPKIIRIYDIITHEESSFLRKLAKTRLFRSTVQSKYGSLASNFRIAKTAWLPRELDPIILNIEKRLSDIFQLDLSNSEDLQVVNYGIGGYYGPHLDSFKGTSENDRRPSRIGKSKLAKNDRLATILIYLNSVEAGGATVFPKLNLTVEPIERSAVFWFNIKNNGYTDHKTLHTGCPVLMGSKWIATKWPRENENIFKRKNVTFYKQI